MLGVKCKKEQVECLDLMIGGALFIVIGIYLGRMGCMLLGSVLVIIYTMALLYFNKTQKLNPIFNFSSTITFLIAALLFGAMNLEKGLILYITVEAITIFLSLSLGAQIIKMKKKE